MVLNHWKKIIYSYIVHIFYVFVWMWNLALSLTSSIYFPFNFKPIDGAPLFKGHSVMRNRDHYEYIIL